MKPDVLWDINQWADWWRGTIGVNVIPVDTQFRKGTVTWKQWQDKPIPEDLHKFWKETGEFEKHGIGVVVGRTWHLAEEKYLFCIDCDNGKAIEMISSDRNKLIEGTLCEWHDDNPSKMHVYGYSSCLLYTSPSPRDS